MAKLCGVVTSVIILILALGLAKWISVFPMASQGVVYYYINSSNPERQLFQNDTQLELDPNHPFYIIIHGFTESSSRPWIKQLSSGLLEQDPLSTILLIDHWNLLDFSRPRMTNNVAIIAQSVAGFINNLQNNNNLKLENVHIIGFSLGGLISGVIPHYLVGKVRRITGIDPSFPWKTSGDTKEYLDEGDAHLVVGIRTSSVGLETPPLHIDFYINGGEEQPECKIWWHPFFVRQICSHYKAPFLFLAALREDAGSSCLCQQRIQPDPQLCSCSQRNSFGLNTNERLRGTFYMKT